MSVFKGKDAKKADSKSGALPPKAGSSLGLRSQSTSTGPATVTPVAIPPGVVGTFTNHETNLAALLAFDQKTVPGAKVPIIVSKCCNRLFEMGLSTEGIFRVPGNSSRLMKCENEFNLGQGASVDFKRMGITVEDAASLLKKFLRESLNDTLFPASMVPEFEMLRQLENGEAKNAAFLKLWDRLPSINRAVLSEVLELLMNVAANSFLNLMNVDNLGTVFGGMADIPMPAAKWMLVYLLEEYENLFASPALQSSVQPVLRRKLINHTRSIFTLAHLQDKYVISADGGVAVNVWDARTFAHIKKVSFDMKCYVPQVFVTVESAQIHQLWTMFPDAIRIWDASSILNPNLKKFDDNPANVINIPNACVCVQVGENIWVASEKVVVLDAITHQILKELPEYQTEGNGQPLHVMGYAAGYIWIWRGKTLHVWQPETYTKVREIIIEGYTSPKTCQIFHADGLVWLSTDNGAFLIVDVSKFEVKSVVQGHSAAVYHIERVGDLIWSCSWDTTICWWRTTPTSSTVELVAKMPNRHSDAVSYLLPIWREHLNGWDVWSASWDRSCQVTFVPASYAQHLPSPDSISSVDSSSAMISSSSVPLAGGSNLQPSSSAPLIHTLPPATLLTPPQTPPMPRPSSPTGLPAAAPLSIPTGIGAGIANAWGRTPTNATPLLAQPPLAMNSAPVLAQLPPLGAVPPNPTGLGAHSFTPPTAQVSLPQLEAQLKDLEAKLTSLSLHNDRELDNRLGGWTNPPSAGSASELRQFIKQANEQEVELQLQLEEVRLRIRGELHAQRYALIYARLAGR